MVDGSIRETWLVIEDQRHGILAWNVCGRNDDELAPRNLRCELNSGYVAARNFTPDGHTMDDSRKGEVIDILRAAGHLVATFFPWNRLTDESLARHWSYYDAPGKRGKSARMPRI